MLIEFLLPTEKNGAPRSSAPSVRGRNTLPRRVPSFVQLPQHAVGASVVRTPQNLWVGVPLLLLFVALPLLVSSMRTEPQRALVALPIEQTLLAGQPQKPSHPDGLLGTPATVAVKASHQASVPTQSVAATGGSNRFIVRFGTHWVREAVDLRPGPTQDWARYRNRRQPQTAASKAPIPFKGDAVRLVTKHHLRDGALLAGWLPLLARGDRFKHPNDYDLPDERTFLGNQSFLLGAGWVIS